ncbi:mimitin, mitochondrial [Alligator mississippiensis]|uniref:Mimitin, mitochondrial n=1 Tax=Alligator mississippiensis TaxID=8496 RepID=A0A151MXI9_ALLMI|nr:mimitin, mitochondrial [Alligator mississippiensis]
MSVVARFVRTLRLRLFGPGQEHVGADSLGNKYYRVPEHRTWAGQTIPERRGLDAVNLEPFQYEVGTIPAEWEAWLRKKRKDPPTIEEILKNEKYRGEMQLKIKDVSEKDKLLQAKEYKEGLVAEPVSTQIKGHASAHYYGKNQPSQDPTSIANTFQPGSWMPPDGSSHNK